MSTFTIDIEPTNRCNASCHFCPRDATPHQGLMSQPVFEQSLARAIEYREHVRPILDVDQATLSLCGLGEPLLNKRVTGWVADVKAAGFTCQISSNGARLDEARGAALLDNGLDRIFINVGERGASYEEIYQLPWEQTRDNVLRFAAMAEGRCEVYVVLVDHRGDADHQAEMRRYWSDHGITLFNEYEIINRGGALFVDHMQYETMPEARRAADLLAESGQPALCGAPFGYLFVGYDGIYYLCCSDWHKEVPLGSVHDRSFVDVLRAKLEHVATRDPICRTCNLDPHNHLTDQLRRDPDADGESLAAGIATGSAAILAALERMQPGVTDQLPQATPTRRLIPVSTP